MCILEICLSNWELKTKGILNRRQGFLWTAPSGFAFEARLLSCFQGNGVRDQSFSAFEDKFRIVTSLFGISTTAISESYDCTF